LLKIAYFSPLPPQRTGIADYSAELLPHLAQEAKITLFVSEASAVSPELQARFPMCEVIQFPHVCWQYDIALYQMGNSLFHRDIYTMLKRYPGLTVLHDYVLHHFVACVTAGEGNFAAYVRELAYAMGRDGAARAHAIQRGESPTPLFEWPLNERVVDLSVGVLVHSDYVRRQLLAAHPLARVRKVNQPIPLPSRRDRSAVRNRLSLPGDAFIVITCGQVTPEKRLDLLLRAFARFHRHYANTLWLIVGEPAVERGHWDEAVRSLGVQDAVQQVGYVEGLETLYDYIAASDVCANLRFPTVGETSASVLRAMAIGCPVVVSDVGWYGELPDDCCSKLAHEGAEVETLAQILLELAGDPERCREIGECGRAYVAERCDPRTAARTYLDFIADIISAL
jgi:glycosyltransferase involved in cell wall biosynthesis